MLFILTRYLPYVDICLYVTRKLPMSSAFPVDRSRIVGALAKSPSTSWCWHVFKAISCMSLSILLCDKVFYGNSLRLQGLTSQES